MCIGSWTRRDGKWINRTKWRKIDTMVFIKHGAKTGCSLVNSKCFFAVRWFLKAALFRRYRGLNYGDDWTSGPKCNQYLVTLILLIINTGNDEDIFNHLNWSKLISMFRGIPYTIELNTCILAGPINFTIVTISIYWNDGKTVLFYYLDCSTKNL